MGSAIEFLSRNGYAFEVSAFDVYKHTIALAGEDVVGDRKEILSQIQSWIEDHLQEIV